MFEHWWFEKLSGLAGILIFLVSVFIMRIFIYLAAYSLVKENI